jgi:hypothetical protein
MTYRPRARCISCGTPRALAGGLSRHGKCQPCGEAALEAALRQLASHSGPVYDRWLDGLTEAVARLQGERHIPDTPLEIPALFELTEVVTQ